jgi:hypothetical protein
MAERLLIKVDGTHTVSGLLQVPDSATARLVLAHGAGAGMEHPFMAAVANGLHARRMAALRYQFPYMEQRLKRPDGPPLAHSTVRAAVRTAGHLVPSLPTFAGGKSFGGRMTSQAQAEEPLPGIRGLVFLGFPLHQANQPSGSRAEHLLGIRVPMLFLQGTRDKLADMSLLVPLFERLKPTATLVSVDDADHSFHCPAVSGRTDPRCWTRWSTSWLASSTMFSALEHLGSAIPEPRYPNAVLQRRLVL